MTHTRIRYLFFSLYVLFIVYGSLFPLSDWRFPQENLVVAWTRTIRDHISRGDLITNLLAYFPFGFLLCSSLSIRFRDSMLIPLSAIHGFGLSFAMEYCQLYLPARTSSPVDLLLNTFSALSGALAYCWLGRGSHFGDTFRVWRNNCFMEGKTADIGLGVFALWAAAQLAPFVPSLDAGGLKNGLKPVWLTIHELSRFNLFRMLIYTLNIGALGAVLLLIKRDRYRASVLLVFFCGAVLLTKITITGRQLSLEALTGLVMGVVMMFVFRMLPKNRLMLAGACSVIAAFVIDELRSELTQPVFFHTFNWIPFKSQVTETVSGVGGIIEGMWPFATSGFFAVAYVASGNGIPVKVIGGLLVAGVCVLEYSQSFIPGRYPDITPALLAAFGWLLPLLWGENSGE